MEHKIIIAPSLLACNFSVAGNEVKKIEQAGADWLHLDVMDGLFVPNISFGPCVISSLRNNTSLFFDVHLMIQNPIRYIDDYRRAGADMITFHIESCSNQMETIDAIHKSGAKAGIAVKPGTASSTLLPYLDRVDMILIMSVEPGFGGQSFMPAALDKLVKTRKMIAESGRQIYLEVDGGIGPKNINRVLAAGADTIVAGSSVFHADDPADIIQCLRG